VILIEANTDGTTCTWVGYMPRNLPVAMAESAHEAERSEMSSLAAEQLGRTLPGGQPKSYR
jgi:pyruvate/2-oxoglutarate dehydrogenase complex dihydrolipoamide dehydrogenase (E3) component